MTLEQVRTKLKATSGKQYWRSIDELQNTPEFQAAVEKEFPSAAQEWVDPVSRRGFLKIMGASMALAGLAGCTKQPDEPIYPYVKAPEDLLLGKPNYFASVNPLPTGGVPVLVKSDQFRPVKVDGNPDHAYNHGSSDVFSQGSLLDLYDPDRSQHVTFEGENREWAEFAQALHDKVASTKDGTGIYFLSATITSPTLARQWKAVQAAYPKATLVQYDPAIAGTFLAKGYNVQYDLSSADVIVSLDADFLSGASYPGFHKLVADYAKRRKDPANGMNRLYTIESTPTTTGMKAEHRLGLRASEVPAFAAALASAVGAAGASAPQYAWTGEQQKFLAALAKDLKASSGKSAVLPGLYQDESVAALALAINQALGNVGKTVIVSSEPAIPLPSDQNGDFKNLVADLNAGKVDWLVILNANPVYSSPADLGFTDLLQQGQGRRASRLALRRDRPPRALAHSCRALPRVVVRCARLRRHRLHRAADDRAALWRQERARRLPDAARQSAAQRLRSRPHHAERQHQGRLRDRLAQGSPRRLDRRHRLRATAGSSV